MTAIQKKRRNHFIWMGLFLGIASSIYPWLSVFDRWELTTLDFRFTHFNSHRKASDRVVVIDIDEQSLKILAPHYGRFPWRRKVYKDLLEFISNGNPSAILFDILFTESFLEGPDDSILADASKQYKVVSHAMNFLKDRAVDGTGPNPLPAKFQRFSVNWKGPHPSWLVSPYIDYAIPAPDYLPKIPYVHAVTVEEDSDGRMRRVPLVFRYGESIYPWLGFQGLLLNSESILSAEGKNLVFQQGQNKTAIPIDKSGNLQLYFYRSDRDPEVIPYAPCVSSARKLLKGEVGDPSELEVNPLQFKDKVVLIGTSAVGLEDLKSVPTHELYPGVKLAATLISNIVQKDFLRPAAKPLQLSLCLWLVLFVFASTVLPSSAWIRIPVPLLTIATYLGITGFLFQTKLLWFDWFGPLVISGSALVEGFAFISILEMRERKQREATLSKYLSPSVAVQLISSGEDITAQVGQEKELSIFFSDIRNFTTLSEATDPRNLVAHLNDYLGQVTDLLFQLDGTLDKFIGDAVMAFWGAPMSNPRHAALAVDCALKVQELGARLRQEWKVSNPRSILFYAGVGINTGKAIVGNIGSTKRLDYTVIGDNVNLASRIESLTKSYGVSILVSQSTFDHVKNDIIFRHVDSVTVKGKTVLTDLHEPLGRIDDLSARRLYQDLQLFRDASRYFREENWLKAQALFQQADRLRSGGDGPSQYFYKKCEQHLFNKEDKSHAA